MSGWSWGLGSAAERIVKRYGQRSGSIINGTGTGTQLVLSLNNYNTYTDGVADIFEDDGKLYITALSPSGAPIRPHSLNITGVRRTLNGRVLSYRKYPTIDIDIAVIGNSLDYYRLSMLAAFYMRRGLKTYVPNEDTDPESTDEGGHHYARHDMPLLNMDIQSSSAPGANITLSGGVMVDADPIMGIDGRSKITDKVFSFSFAAMTVPSWSKQFYDPNASPNIIEEVTGVQFL